MLELFALVFAALAVGAVLLVGCLALLPLYVLFRILGFAARVTLGAMALALGAIILLPLVILIGLVLLVKVLVFGIPLLLVGLMAWWLFGFLRPATA